MLTVTSLAGCVSPAQRMADCEKQGISRDTCYQVEQQRQMNADNAARAASQQALLEDSINESLKSQHPHKNK